MNKLLLLSAIFFYLSVLPGQAQKLQINEIMSSNTHTLLDEDGEFPDWIELINTSSQIINLSEYFLADDLKNPTQWQFPDMELQSGEIIVVFASGKDRKNIPSHWKSLIKKGDDWKYLVPQQEISGWYSPEFDDSSWATGTSGFGYGDNDDATIIQPLTSIFMRKEFTIDGLSEIQQMVLSMDYDDGFVAYLNGTEIARANLGTSGVAPAFDALATVDHEANIYQGFSPGLFNIENFAELLQTGANVLAVQVHNNHAGSSDFTAIPFLSALTHKYPDNVAPPILNLAGANLHTNFKLDAHGDSLFIFNANGQEIDELIITPIPIDISTGYKEGDFSQLFIFAYPTPWEANTSQALIIDEHLTPVFSQEGGIFNNSVTLSLSTANAGDTIYYTTDGSDPNLNSLFFINPITISEPTTIRARIIKYGYFPGKIITQSYYPEYDKSLPIVFVSTNPDNLWDYNTGIYVKGPNASPNFPYKGANFWQDWEKPAHVELYFPSGKSGFSIDAGLKIFGNYTRGYTQKSMAVYARSQYGDKNINCKLFDDKPIDKFESIILRSGGTDNFGENQFWGTLFRDRFIANIGLQMNLDAQAGFPCVVYLNGEYWGIHNIREKVNEHFLADNNGIDSDEINLLELDSEIIYGSNEHYREMMSFIYNNDMSFEGNYEYVKTQMDIDNYIRYNVIELFSYNDDWPGNNIKYWRENSAQSKWRWILFDVDTGFGLWDPASVYTNSIAIALKPDGTDWPNPAWSTLLFRSLMQNESFKKRFINTFADHMNTTLLPQKVNPLVTNYANQIDDEIDAHTEKWGSDYDIWLHNVDGIKNFADKRPSAMRKIMLEQFAIADTQIVNLNITGCDDAYIYLNTITINEFPWDGIYFNQIPIELTALAPAGYKFVRWEGDLQSTEPKIQVSMETDMSLTAVFEEDDQSGTVVINEIMYNPANEFDSDDWVELYNNSTRYINLTNWTLKDSDDANSFKFAPNTVLAPNEYLVVCREPTNFSLIHPETSDVQGPLGFGFSSAGECIRLFDNTSNLVDQVCYASEYPWPTEPNGGGYTLGLNDPNQDNSLAANWFTSQSINGSPGKANTATGVEETVSQSDQSFLLQNYPNPFTGNTRIPVYSKSNETVNISVFNLEGQLVSTVFQGNLSKGYHTFEWEAPTNAPGIYLIKYSGPNHLSVKKAICH
ncbi:CotH kinase family protein [Gaoshiqia sediminis]|uniref:CotH kinase family protein n=1 Tax=Gaoshiqia sediminis TaxID=2986998 RepID=A0AA41Y9I8_9BACT|nr:CotH kinase family protein [Gaoshiqia sediminis]MCW0483757.1 CotH kinase family protein [Gaoshiqia sediminis]